MLRSSSLGIVLFINFLIICLWLFLSRFIGRHIGSKHVDYRKFPYRAREFEKRGDFYKENFDIDSWYTYLPTEYNRLGSTPAQLEKLDTLALKERLPVVCRSELFALINCFYIVCAAVLDAAHVAFILGMLVILAQIPLILSARYCRCLILNEIVNKRRELERQSILADRTPNVFDLDLLDS